MTYDAPYEIEWRPIPKRNPDDLPRDLEQEDKEKYEYVYNRKQVDENLFDLIQDQGDIMQSYLKPDELIANMDWMK